MAVLVLLSVSAADTNRTARPAMWASPLESVGASNFYKVSDRLYRSAQPSAEGMAKLKELGVQMVVNLLAAFPSFFRSE